MDILRFALLGLGAGAVYGLAALGIVLVYRGSGVLNFAHGAVGMVGAFVFYLQRESGTPTLVAGVLALAVGAAIGAATHLGVMRPLRAAPAIVRLIATLAVFSLLFGFGQLRWGVGQSRIVESLLPDGSWTMTDDLVIGWNRVWLVVIGVVLTAVLTVVYRRTEFGLATSAVAENRRASAAVGVSPDRIATVNWVLGSMLAVLSGILIVSLTSLQVEGLALLVIPALAAALVGGFKSFGLTFAGGLLIGILESEIAWLQTKYRLEGMGRTVPFIVIIVVLVIAGRALPLRGEAAERPPEIGTGQIRPSRVGIVGAIVLGLTLFVFSDRMLDSVTMTFGIGLVVLSLVVVTGYAGQVSLAQMSLAGMGAWVAARLVANWDVPFELAFLAGVLVSIPLGVLVGLPALRSRGMNLAVVTLGLAVVLESQVLASQERTGGVTGTNVGVPSVFGIDLDTFAHPERYATFCAVVFFVTAIMVANLRRSRAGRRLVAVRANERAAASLGISVFKAKLYAFGLASGLAAAGGVLLAFRRPTVVFVPTFAAFQSIFTVVFAVIGGVGFIVGAIIGAAHAGSAFIPTGMSGLLDGTWVGDQLKRNEVAQLMTGFVLLFVLLQLPNGLATSHPPPLRPLVRLQQRLRARRAEKEKRPPLPAAEPSRVEPRSMRVTGATVRFGGVVAVDGVDLVLEPGKVHGLIGPNGAGKTTFIDAATGFVTLAEGRIELDGVDVTRWSTQRRANAGVARSFQSLELFETMTVRENLRAACDRRDDLGYLTGLLGREKEELSPAAIAAVHEFGLETDLDRRPDELPYGRRRLVAIARAVASGSSILMLDEPAAGLDANETAEVGRLIRRLADEWGMAVLLVEHDVAMVLRTSDVVTVLDFGHRIASGTPEEIREDPAVIAAYLGTSAADAAGAEPRRPVVATGAPVVAARGLSAGYGDLPAVRDLDLAVAPGEIVALLGPNGAGKTTTLLALAGELQPMAGAIEFQGETTRSPLHKRARQGLAFVPEERSVFMALSAADNLRLGVGATERALELFPELRDLLGRRAGLLSGGEQQILTLARALAARPKLILADELSLGLAPKVVERLMAALRRAADEDGVAVVLVEQHASMALSIADRAMVLRRGNVELAGTADEVRAGWADLEQAYLAGPVPVPG